MTFIKERFFFKSILSISIVALISAYYIEHILGHAPCNLCLIERYIYFISIIIVAIFLVINRYEKIILFILGITFVFSTLVSFYHFGIEQNFFQESQICKINLKGLAETQEDILKSFEIKKISCKDVTFRVLGLSLATLNTILSFIISIIIYFKLMNYGKNR